MASVASEAWPLDSSRFVILGAAVASNGVSGVVKAWDWVRDSIHEMCGPTWA